MKPLLCFIFKKKNDQNFRNQLFFNFLKEICTQYGLHFSHSVRYEKIDLKFSPIHFQRMPSGSGSSFGGILISDFVYYVFNHAKICQFL